MADELTHQGVKRACKRPCKECPFRRDAAKGWLGAYDGAQDFLDTHYRYDVPNPCHTTVDYNDPEWKSKLGDAIGCAGQQIFYENSLKKPRMWSLDPDIEADTHNVFQWPQEFLDHHNVPWNRKAPEKPEATDADADVLVTTADAAVEILCFHCAEEVDDEDTFCHGCGVNICDDCERNHTLMGPHDPIDHLYESDDL